MYGGMVLTMEHTCVARRGRRPSPPKSSSDVSIDRGVECKFRGWPGPFRHSFFRNSWKRRNLSNSGEVEGIIFQLIRQIGNKRIPALEKVFRHVQHNGTFEHGTHVVPACNAWQYQSATFVFHCSFCHVACLCPSGSATCRYHRQTQSSRNDCG